MNGLSLDNVQFNSVNGVISNFIVDNMNINGTNNFSIDLDGLEGISDKFTIGNLGGNGIANVAHYNIIGVPTAERIDFRIFNPSSGGDDVVYTESVGSVRTPIYQYLSSADGNGWYSLTRNSFNEQVFRGKVATLAMLNNQVIINNVLFDHVYLDSNDRVARLQHANRYAAILPMFAPYQFVKNEGGLWFKSYAGFEKLAMTNDLNVGNNYYGGIVGADFPIIDLKRGWKFLPTTYLAYNGGNQYFKGVRMYQNGGQGGFMGTFAKRDFIGSFLAYAGGYDNEMSLDGANDNTGNWFAGTAAKAAYNFRPVRNVIVQPNALVSYNIFGKQKWNSDYGALSMNAGYLNGINVAPGLNVIYNRETWSVYLTTQYVFYINDQISGRAGNIELPSVKMRHGFFEYGIGWTKKFKDRLLTFGQVTVRNGGRTGIGFQLGLTWEF